MAKRDYYDILGVSKNSSLDEIKKAFRKLSRQWHPDAQHGKSDSEKKEAEEKFKEIAEAYEVLSDDSKRKQYDQFGFSGSQGFGGQDVNLGDFFRKHASVFEGMFGNPFANFNSSDDFGNFNFGFGTQNFGKGYGDSPKNGRDVQVKMNISLKECIFGTVREFDIPIDRTCKECNGSGHSKDSKEEICPECNGQGMVTEIHKNGFMISKICHPCGRCNGTGWINSIPCKHCSGKGRVTEKSHFIQKIPAGVVSGNSFVINGAGEGGVNGGKNGNLIIVVDVQTSDEFFTRNEKTAKLCLGTKVYVSPLITLFGGKTEVVTPYGIKETFIPAGTSNGDIIKIEGCGIRTPDKKGDLFATVIFDNLTYLSDDDVKMLKEIHSHIGPSNLKHQKEISEKFKTWQ